MDRFALDPARFEVRTVRSLRDLSPEVTRHFDLLVATRREASGWSGLETAATFESEEPDAGLALLVLRPAGDRATWRLAPQEIRASHDEARAGATWDEEPGAVWTAPAGPGWIEARWSDPATVDRVEVEAGPEPDGWPQDLTLFGAEEGRGFEEIATFALRPNRPARQRRGAPHGQVYVLTPPRSLSRLRIERRAGGPWSLASVRVFALTGRSRSSPSPAGS
jgi:hypothetical protein